jgi:hypothetical protein
VGHAAGGPQSKRKGSNDVGEPHDRPLLAPGWSRMKMGSSQPVQSQSPAASGGSSSRGAAVSSEAAVVSLAVEEVSMPPLADAVLVLASPVDAAPELPSLVDSATGSPVDGPHATKRGTSTIHERCTRQRYHAEPLDRGATGVAADRASAPDLRVLRIPTIAEALLATLRT